MSGLDEKAVEAIAEFLKLRDESVMPDEADDDERIDSAKAILEALSAVGQKAGTVEVKPLSAYRQVGQCNCGDCLRIRQAGDNYSSAPSVAEAAEPGEFVAFQSEINPDVWYVGNERVAFLRTEVGVGNASDIAKRAAAGLNATHPAPSPVVPSGLEALVEPVAWCDPLAIRALQKHTSASAIYLARQQTPAYSFPLYDRTNEAAFRRMCRENYDAFCAMRNDINELVGNMVSQESTLAYGPEQSHECAAVVKAVADAIAAIRSSATKQEKADAARSALEGK